MKITAIVEMGMAKYHRNQDDDESKMEMGMGEVEVGIITLGMDGWGGWGESRRTRC